MYSITYSDTMEITTRYLFSWFDIAAKAGGIIKLLQSVIGILGLLNNKARLTAKL